MPPKEVQIQPRRQPPKAQELQNEQAIIHAKAAQSAAAAADVPPVDAVEGTFQDAQAIFHEGAPTAPTQEELTRQALDTVKKTESAHAATQVAQTGPIHNPANQVKLVPVVEQPLKPPSTVGELKAQHARPTNERYPDVAELFSGRVPNEPVAMPKVIEKPPAPQVIRKEVVITHQIVDPNQAMICLKECDIYVRDVMVHFGKDQLVTDFSQIDAIRLADSPNFAPYGELDTFEKCPHCGNCFPGKNSAVKYGS